MTHSAAFADAASGSRPVRARRRRALAAAGLAALMSLAACQSGQNPFTANGGTSRESADGGSSGAAPGSGGSESAPSSKPPQSRSGAAVAPKGPRTDAEVLAAIGFQQSDLASPNLLVGLPSGTSVAGGPTGTTLDLCNASFPSESLRTGRNQVVVGRPEVPILASSEAVAYKDAAATDQAFRELRAAAAACGQTPAPSGGAGAGADTTAYAIGPAVDAGWPQVAGVERLTFNVTATKAGEAPRQYITNYLRCGRLLVGVYLNQPDKVPATFAATPDIASLVTRMQYRLASLSPALCDAPPPGAGQTAPDPADGAPNVSDTTPNTLPAPSGGGSTA